MKKIKQITSVHGYLKRALFYLIFLVFCFQFLALIAVFNHPNAIYADEGIQYKLQVYIPGIDEGKIGYDRKEGVITVKENTLSLYMAAVFKYSIAVVGIIATVMIVVGGVIWLTSAGNSTQITTAKSYIAGALGGLALAFGSVSLLWLINPNLVYWDKLNIQKIAPKEKICCEYNLNNKKVYFFSIIQKNLTDTATQEILGRDKLCDKGGIEVVIDKCKEADSKDSCEAKGGKVVAGYVDCRSHCINNENKKTFHLENQQFPFPDMTTSTGIQLMGKCCVCGQK